MTKEQFSQVSTCSDQAFHFISNFVCSTITQNCRHYEVLPLFKQSNFTVNHKSCGKMESVAMDVVAEENQEECLGIQDQTSAEVQVSMEVEVSHCHLLAQRTTGLHECIL